MSSPLAAGSPCRLCTTTQSWPTRVDQRADLVLGVLERPLLVGRERLAQRVGDARAESARRVEGEQQHGTARLLPGHPSSSAFGSTKPISYFRFLQGLVGLESGLDAFAQRDRGPSRLGNGPNSWWPSSATQ